MIGAWQKYSHSKSEHIIERPVEQDERTIFRMQQNEK